MGAKAATYELRWRLSDIDGVPAPWSTKTVPANSGTITIGHLERGREYEIEARALSAAGAASAWVTVPATVADASLKPRAPTGLTVLPIADAVSLKWTADAKQPADVEYSIEVGTSAVGPWSEFTQTRAMQYSLPLNDGVVRWFRVRAVNFGAVFSAYSNVVSAAAIPLAELEADVAAAAANAAAALAALADIANDGKLTANEKIIAKREYEALTSEQAGIDDEADQYGIVTEKTAYDAAVTALKNYLKNTVGVLNAGFVWTNVTGTTTITRATWNANWTAVYNTRQALLNAIVAKARALAAVMSAGANLIPNPTFISNEIGTPTNTSLALNAHCSDNWRVTRSEAAFVNTYLRYFPAANAAIRSLVGNPPIPNGTIVAPQIRTIQPVAVEAGAKYVVSVEWIQAYNGVLPGTVTAKSRVSVQFFNDANVQLGLVAIERLRGAAAPEPLTITAPANARYAHIYADSHVHNSSGAVYAHADSVILRTDFRSISLIRSYSLDTDVTDGSEYVRYGVEDAYFSGGKWRNGLRFNASGQQVSGAFNFPPGGFANVGAGWVTGGSVSYIASAGTPATATISVSALTLRSMGSDKAYSASAVNVNGVNGSVVKYHLYYDDDQYAGGARTLAATTSMNTIMASRSRLYVGSVSVTYPMAGVGGGGGGTPCPTMDSWLACGRRAGAIRWGHWLRLADPYDGLRARVGRVSRATPARAPCVRLVTEQGAELECSTSAPIPTPGGYRLAPECGGCRVPIRRIRWTWLMPFARWLRHCRWAWREGWERVVHVEAIGERWVMHITCENACFWVGKRRHALFLHHNLKQDP